MLYVNLTKKLAFFRANRITIVVLFILSFSSCKKLVEVEPPITEITGSSVYNENATAIGVLTGIYANMSTGSIYAGHSGLSLFAGLSADELALYGSGSSNSLLGYYYQNALFVTPNNSTGTEFCES